MCQFKFCRAQKRYFTSTRQLGIEPTTYSVLAFSSKSTLGLPVSLLAPFFTLLGFGYVLYNLTINTNPSTDELVEIIDRSTYLWQAGLQFHFLLNDFLTNINTNINHYSYSELMSLYDSLNQLYIEVNGYLNNLDYLAKSSASIRDGGTLSKDWIKLASEFRSDHNNIIELLKLIEPRIDAYKFFSELYF